jgi:hypothetical protein
MQMERGLNESNGTRNDQLFVDKSTRDNQQL